MGIKVYLFGFLIVLLLIGGCEGNPPLEDKTKSMNVKGLLGEVAKGGVLLVEFWTPGCPVCEEQSEAVRTIARKYDGRVTVIRVNMAEDINVARGLNILYAPTIQIFKNRKGVEEKAGFPLSAKQLSRLLDKHLSS